MKDLLTILLLWAALLPAAQGQSRAGAQPQAFTLSGMTNAELQGTLSLTYFTGARTVVTDTLKNGRFEFSGLVFQPHMAYLRFSPAKPEPGGIVDLNFRQIYLEPGQTTLRMNTDLRSAAISGGSGLRDWLKLEQPLVKIQDRIAMLNDSLQKNGADQQRINQLIAALSAQYNAVEDAFITHHPGAALSWLLVKNRGVLLQDPGNLGRLLASLDAVYRDSEQGKALAKRVALAQGLVAGKKASDFSLPDTSGRMVRLSDYRGQYVFVDFWASWCGFCRAENPHVLKAYEQFKSRNFQVLAVSLDDKREAWIRAIRQDKMPWTQLGDLKGWKSAVAVQYALQALPQSFLLDPQGVIISTNLRGDELYQKLQQVIPSEKQMK